MGTERFMVWHCLSWAGGNYGVDNNPPANTCPTFGLSGAIEALVSSGFALFIIESGISIVRGKYLSKLFKFVSFLWQWKINLMNYRLVVLASDGLILIARTRAMARVKFTWGFTSREGIMCLTSTLISAVALCLQPNSCGNRLWVCYIWKFLVPGTYFQWLSKEESLIPTALPNTARNGSGRAPSLKISTPSGRSNILGKSMMLALCSQWVSLITSRTLSPFFQCRQFY